MTTDAPLAPSEQNALRFGELALAGEFISGPKDHLRSWLDFYLSHGDSSGESTRQNKRRDLTRFLEFMEAVTGGDRHRDFTPRLARQFFDALQAARKPDNSRLYRHTTINRFIRHLKAFCAFIHTYYPFPLGLPTKGLKSLAEDDTLNVDRAITGTERNRLLDAADALLEHQGKSKDRVRAQRALKRGEDPRRHKSARPYRNRAIVYLLIESGIRREAITTLDLDQVDFATGELREVLQKDKRRRVCVLVSKEGLAALQDYVTHERTQDAPHWPTSPALFLPAPDRTNSTGRLTVINVNGIWNRVRKLAAVENRSPHCARHGMGKRLLKATGGNLDAVRRQLGHANTRHTLSYARTSRKELQDALNKTDTSAGDPGKVAE